MEKNKETKTMKKISLLDLTCIVCVQQGFTISSRCQLEKYANVVKRYKWKRKGSVWQSPGIEKMKEI